MQAPFLYTKHALAKTKHIFLYKRIRLSSERQVRVLVYTITRLGQDHLLYKNRAITFRMTILFFCGEIYAQSQPRRVLLYKNSAITFRMTILFLYRNIYLVLTKACYIRLKQRKYLSDGNLILLQRFLCLVLAKTCFCIQKWRLPFS